MTLTLGWCCYDADHRTPLPDRIARAVAAYTAKRGHAPNVCVINDRTDDAPPVVAGVRVARARWMQGGHYWLGVESD